MVILILNILLGICALVGMCFLVAAIFGFALFQTKKPLPVSSRIVNLWAAMIFLGMPLIVYCRELEKAGWGWPVVFVLWAVLIPSVIAAILSEQRSKAK